MSKKTIEIGILPPNIPALYLWKKEPNCVAIIHKPTNTL